MNKPKIIFRADGNSQIGLGHLIRALSLVSMLKNDYDCAFAIQEPADAIKNIIRTECDEIIELAATGNLSEEAKYLASLEADCLVLDGYHFDLPYMQVLKNASKKLVFIDDIFNKQFVADVVINPAGGIDESKYHIAPYTKLFTGPEYAILREAFLDECLYDKTVKTRPENFLVCLGGADPVNKTIEVVCRLLQINSTEEINVVVGAAYPFINDLEAILHTKKIIIHKNLDSETLCKLMQNSDAAVCSPSTVSYEWCCTNGLLFLLQTADNQASINNFLIEEGLALPYSQLKEILEKEDLSAIQNEQILAQRKYFDGKSKFRLQKVFNKLILTDLLHFKKAIESDVKILFDWANDEEVRQASFNTEKIAFEDHNNWFQKKLNDPKTLICIAQVKNVPAGMMRFDIKPNETTISYLLDEKFRGKSLGSAMLTKGIAFFKSNYNGTYPPITGYIKTSNTASIKAFLKAGFEKIHDENSFFADAGKCLLKAL